MQAEIKRLQEVIKKSSQDAQKLMAERNKLADANQEMKNSFEKTSEQFHSTMEQYETELQRLQQELVKSAKQQQQQATSKDQQTPASQQESEYKAKFEKAVEAIRAFQKTSDDMKREIIKLNDKNKSLGAENQSLADSLRAAQEALATLQSGEGMQQQQSQDLMKKQLSDLLQSCDSLKRDLAKQSTEANKFREENQKMRVIIEKSSQESIAVKSERDRLQAQLEKLLVELEKREVRTLI